MSNAIARIEAATAAIELFNSQRAVSRLEVQRTTKSGKVQTRDALGIAMSGNKAEHAALAKAIAESGWFAGDRAQYATLMNNMLRVFPKLQKAIDTRNATVNTLIAEDPQSKLRLIVTSNPSKQDVIAAAIIARGLPGADKGEKAVLMDVVNHVATLEKELQSLIAERNAAEKELQSQTA